MIISGEPSGDRYGGDLARELYALSPGIELFGMGGDKMKSAGVKIVYPADHLAIIGLWAILKKWKIIRAAFSAVYDFVRQQKPDLVVLIDYPGFNLMVAKKLSGWGIPVAYYITPQVWAWHTSRVKKIKAYVKKCLVIFPFEKEFFQKHGIEAEFVGHPLVDKLDTSPPDEEFYQKYNLDPNRPVLGIMPGSRPHEVDLILPAMLGAAALIQKACPEIQSLLIRADSLEESFLSQKAAALGWKKDLAIAPFSDSRVLGAVKFVLAKSGTTTLEVALRHIPMAIVYRADALAWFVIDNFVKVPFAGLPNIVAGRELCREFLQNAAQPEAIAAYALEFLQNPKTYEAKKTEIITEMSKLQGTAAARHAAEAVLKMV